MVNRLFFTILLFFCLCFNIQAGEIGNAIEQFGESIEGGLDNLGQTLNNANNAILGRPQPDSFSYEQQMRAYREAENARVNEIATVSGVDPNVIRQLRGDGMTWEQIAEKYNVNLSSLPLPPNVPPQ